MWMVDRCIVYTGIRLLLLICLFISSFFFLSNFQHWNFSSHFSGELWGLEVCKLVHMWMVGRKLVHMWLVGRCIMFTRIRLLLLIHPYISSFFLLSNFQHWNFSSHFSQELWGLEDWNLVQRCILYTGIRLLLLICLFISSFVFLSQFSNIKFFCHTFLWNCEAQKIETWYTCGWWADVSGIPESGYCSYLSLYSSFSPFIKH